jgi:hypothetical protein
MTGLMTVTLRASTTRKASTRAGGGGQSELYLNSRGMRIRSSFKLLHGSWGDPCNVDAGLRDFRSVRIDAIRVHPSNI